MDKQTGFLTTQEDLHMRQGSLREHIFGTYLGLRYGLVFMGALFPIVVALAGRVLDGQHLQQSISAYYWTTQNEVLGLYWARVFFVGGLFAVASGLYLYKGFTVQENVALNLAAVFGIGVALFPKARPDVVSSGQFSVHGSCAILMFACLVYVVWFCARDTLHLLDKPVADVYRRRYVIIGLVMLGSPVTAFVLNFMTASRTHFVFWTESVGIWAFAVYWAAKSWELRRTSATWRALHAELEGGPDGEADMTRVPRG